MIWLTNTKPDGADMNLGYVNYVSNEQFGSGSSSLSSSIVVYPLLSSMFEVDGIKYVPVSLSERTCDAIDYVYNESARNVHVPSTVTYKGVTMSVKNIQQYMFYRNPYLNKLRVDIGGNINQCVLFGCSNLEIIIWGEMDNIDEDFFKGCYIGNDVSIIWNNALRWCTKITNLIIADRDTELMLYGGNSYSDEPLFKDSPLESVYIGGNINYSSFWPYYSPFYLNTSLRSVVVGDKKTKISNREFYGCTSLESFTAGDGVTSFGDGAFSGCSSLTELTFGSHLQTIGNEAFSDCSAVTHIISRATVPPTCGTQALDDINKWTCTLTVPEGSKSQYQTADQWKEFLFVEEGTGSGETQGMEKCKNPTICYSKGKLTFSSETDGATCISSITDADITSYSGNEVQLGVTYHIRVYASKPGYYDSDVVSATLCWIDVDPKTEGIENDIAEVRAHAVLIQSNGNTLAISGVDEGTPIYVYDTAGKLQGSAKASAGTTNISTLLHIGEIGIVKIGEKTVKVVMK